MHHAGFMVMSWRRVLRCKTIVIVIMAVLRSVMFLSLPERIHTVCLMQRIIRRCSNTVQSHRENDCDNQNRDDRTRMMHEVWIASLLSKDKHYRIRDLLITTNCRAKLP